MNEPETPGLMGIPPVPRPPGEPARPPRPPMPPDIPLAGDVVEAIARRIGADRLAAWWEQKTGKPCGCEGRKAALNRATGRLLKWLGR
jgi:hypothetical protein